MACTIVFVCYGGAHAQTLLPVIRAVQAAGRFNTVVVGLTLARNYLEERGISCIGFKEMVCAEDSEALAYGRELAANYTGGSVALEETVAYLGLCFRDMVSDIGYEDADAAYAAQGRKAFLPRLTMQRFLSALKPALVVATTSPRAERAAIDAAGTLGIPSLCVTESFMQVESEWIAQPGYGRRVTVLAGYIKDVLVGKGRPPEDVVVTGIPSFDALVAPEIVEHGMQIRAAHGWTEKKTVLWAMPSAATAITGRPFVPADDLFVSLIEATSQLSAQLIVRPHPNNAMPLRDLKRHSNNVIISDPKEDVSPWLHAADTVVVETSTVGLQAALLGKPVVTICADGYPPYAQLGLAHDIPSLDHLASALAAPQASRQDLLNAPALGSATASVVQVIEEMLC